MVLDSNISDALLRIQYPAGKAGDGQSWSAVDELRPLGLLNADLPTLFPYTGQSQLMPRPERSRPRQEVQAATLLRVVADKGGWEEEWIGFWRDHFSVYGYDANVGAFLPHWDKEVVRKYAFSNFRQFLEATASHPAMLYYLNNRSSRAGNANENYARELFELHTLGQGAYLNDLYEQWRSVPGALQGNPTGYIDQDVYEAARCFTGWTVEDGSALGGGQFLPKTGQFIYVPIWHDHYQKRVLATELNPHSPPLSDGRRVLDLCAAHRATANHIMAKLVGRMICDEPPKSLIDGTTKAFIQYQNTPNQLEKVSQYLAKAAATLPAEQRQKVRSPMRLVSVLADRLSINFSLGDGRVLGIVESAGPAVYGWPSPEGPPSGIDWSLSAGYMRQRFTLIQGVVTNLWGTGEWDPFRGMSAAVNYGQFLNFWEKQLFGQPRAELSKALLHSQRIAPSQSPVDPIIGKRLVGYLACAPSFQTETRADGVH